MKNYCLLIITVLISQQNNFAQQGWFWQNPLPQGNWLQSVYFVDESNGWAVGNAGTILKTTDGGISWITNNSFTMDLLNSVYFTDLNNGIAAGWDGLILKTTDGQPFMDRYSTAGNLAPRDIVARACVSEMKRTGKKHVLLDVSHLPADLLRNRFPTIYDTCLRWGIDITREPIPVVPAAHYACGGIQVNTWAESSLPRLYALGECACTGVHGANRLASNSLLEALVFAARAAQHAENTTPLTIPQDVDIKETPDICPDYKLTIKEIMSEYVGVIRTRQGLQTAREKVRRRSRYRSARSLSLSQRYSYLSTLNP